VRNFSTENKRNYGWQGDLSVKLKRAMNYLIGSGRRSENRRRFWQRGFDFGDSGLESAKLVFEVRVKRIRLNQQGLQNALGKHSV